MLAVQYLCQRPPYIWRGQPWVNSLHLADAALRCDAWFELVPSKANLADLPSRDPSTWSSEDAEVMRVFRPLSA